MELLCVNSGQYHLLNIWSSNHEFITDAEEFNRGISFIKYLMSIWPETSIIPHWNTRKCYMNAHCLLSQWARLRCARNFKYFILRTPLHCVCCVGIYIFGWGGMHTGDLISNNVDKNAQHVAVIYACERSWKILNFCICSHACYYKISRYFYVNTYCTHKLF